MSTATPPRRRPWPGLRQLLQRWRSGPAATGPAFDPWPPACPEALPPEYLAHLSHLAVRHGEARHAHHPLA